MRAPFFRLSVLFATLVWSSPGAGETQLPAGRYSVSLPEFAMQSPERIVRFDCNLEGPVLVTISPPLGWQMSVENATSNIEHGTATVKASIVDGVAAFTREDLKYFHHFMKISEEPSEAQRVGGVNIVITVWIATDREMTKYRELRFPTNQLLLVRD